MIPGYQLKICWIEYIGFGWIGYVGYIEQPQKNMKINMRINMGIKYEINMEINME